MRKILPLLIGILFIYLSSQIVFGENITCPEGTHLKNNTCVHYERAISIAPSITEIIYAINAQDNLIGNTIFCNYPEDAKHKTKIGGYTTPNIEKIISLNPDLVFAHDLTDPDDIKLLKDANITVVVINTSADIDGIYYNIRVIAKYLGKESDGENLIKNMEERIEKIKKTRDELIFSHPKMAQIVGAEPIWVSGSNTFIDWIITTAGGINVFSDIYRWNTVSVETLIKRDPDIIIAPTGMGGSLSYITNNPNLKNLKAVKNNDVYDINEDIIYRDGPRVIDALESVMGMIISYQYHHIPKYCMNDSDCTLNKCNISIYICLKLNNEICAFDNECISKNCKNSVCKEKTSTKRSKGYTGGGGGWSGSSSVTPSTYVYTYSENKPINVEKIFPSGIFNFSEIFGLKQTLNLGKDFRNAEITIKVNNKIKKFKVDETGNATLIIPYYGIAEITISKQGYKNFTKTINVYAGKLNIEKISGERYGDEFRFKVTENGKPVKGATVEVYGKTLKTDANGIAKMIITTLQQGLKASVSLNNYKGSSILFDVKAIGRLKVNVPEKVAKGETITITVTDENNNSVPSAKVRINCVEYAADENGKVEYKVTTNSLILKANKEGYVPSEQMSVAVKEKVECGNGKCEEGETKENCPQDCIICGDDVCDTGESYENCPSDCPKPSDNTLLIIVGILIVIMLIGYYLIRKRKGKEIKEKQ